jgi:hypothetical protein
MATEIAAHVRRRQWMQKSRISRSSVAAPKRASRSSY